MGIVWQQADDGVVIFSGQLSQLTVNSLLPIKNQFEPYNSHITFDLSRLDKVDSAGLAYLIELKQYCDNKRIDIDFVKATPALTKLIALYSAEQLLKN